MRLFILTILLGLLLSAGMSHAAEYEITFNGTWSPSDVEPGSYPTFSAHFTPLIGTSHSAGNAFWKNGEPASPGVELVAELGINGALRSELQVMQANGETGEIIEFQDLFDLPNSDTIRTEVDEDKPYITLITMIAPSPDWFVGVSGLPLKENGEWIKQFTVELHPYDAGTEEGNTFSLSNPASPDGNTISRLSGENSPFIGSPVIGTLQFTLIEPPVVNRPPSRPANLSILSPIISLILDN